MKLFCGIAVACSFWLGVLSIKPGFGLGSLELVILGAVLGAVVPQLSRLRISVDG